MAGDVSVPTASLATAGGGVDAGSAPRSMRLERRALALMTDTASNALLGIVFWAAAARLYTTTDVGRAAAVISAATLLATLSQLNLGNVYARFLNSAGSRQRGLVFAGYGVVATVAVLIGAGYALFGPGKVLFTSDLEAWLFPVCVAVLATFALQDLILVSMQRALWVPIENIAWGITKLALLVALASMLPQTGMQIAWVLPAAVAVLAVTSFLLRRRWTADDAPAEPFPGRRALAATVAGEYVTGLVSTAVPLVLPLLVVHRLGLTANAYFAVPWLFATSLSLLMWNVASILLVEAATSPSRLPHLLGRALRLSLAVALAGGTFIWFLGPTILSLLGSGYAEHSVWLLRFTALSAPAVAVVVVWTTASRSRGRLRRVIVAQACIGVSILVLANFLLAPVGVTGIGIAYLTVQWAAALMLLGPLVKLIRSNGRPTGRTTGSAEVVRAVDV